MQTTTPEAVLGWLNFDYQPPCDAIDCKNQAVASVSFVPHQECKKHGSKWYAACTVHLRKSQYGEIPCAKCAGALLVHHVLYL